MVSRNNQGRGLMTSAEPIRPRLIALTETLIINIPNITKINYTLFSRKQGQTQKCMEHSLIFLLEIILTCTRGKRQSQTYGVLSLPKFMV